MSRYNVEYKGKYACFSDIIEDFITKFMDKIEYEIWRNVEYGKNLRPTECRLKTMKEIAFSIRLNKTYQQTIKCLEQSGLSQEDIKQIMYDVETEYYCPIEKK